MTTVSAIERPMGYRELIAENRNFRFLWFGQIISLLGDWFDLIASAALVAQLTGSGLAVGSLFVVRMLAPFVMTPIAGVVADRYNRKHILIASDLLRAATVICFLFVRQPKDVWLLYTLSAVQLGLSAFFFPARNAIIPDIVPPRGIGSANTVSSTTWSTMLAFGAAVGGLVSGGWGIYPAFVIDSISFLLSAWCIAQIHRQKTPELAAAEKTIAAALRQYADGFRYLGQHRDVLMIALQKASNSLVMSAGFQVIQVAIAQQIYVIGNEGGISLGLMFAVSGVGTALGPILARYFTGDDDRQLRWAIAWGYVVGGIGLAISAPLWSFGILLFGTLMRGLGGSIIWTFSTQLLLQALPNQVRGRIFASEFAFFSLTSAIGSAAAGAGLDSSLGISGTIWVMAVATIVPMLFWGWWIAGKREA